MAKMKISFSDNVVPIYKLDAQTKKDIEARGKKMVFLPHTDGISTTDLTKKVKENPVYVKIENPKQDRVSLLRKLLQRAEIWAKK